MACLLKSKIFLSQERVKDPGHTHIKKSWRKCPWNMEVAPRRLDLQVTAWKQSKWTKLHSGKWKRERERERGRKKNRKGRGNFVFGWSKLHFTVSFACCQLDFKGLPDTKERKEGKEKGGEQRIRRRRKKSQATCTSLSSQTGHYDLVLADVLTLIIVECITWVLLSLESENLLHRLSLFFCFPESICLPLPQTRHLQDLPFVLIFVLSRHGHQSFLVLSLSSLSLIA